MPAFRRRRPPGTPVFVGNRIQKDMLMDLNKEYLPEMGITTMRDIIAIQRHSKTVCDQSARDRVLSSQSAVVEKPELPEPTTPEHLTNLVPVAAVSATLSNPTKSSVSRPSSAKSLPSKSRNGFSENKITLPAGGGSSTNIVPTINEGSDKKASLVGSLGKRSAVFKRLECNSNEDEEEDGELDVDIDDAGNGRKSPKKMASKVMLKGIEALGKRSASSGGGGGSIFSRLGEKSNQREQSDGAPAGILKKSLQQPTCKLPPKTQNVTLLKKIPAKTVTAGDDQSLSSRRRSFDRMSSDSEPAKSVSFSKRDEVLEIESHPMRLQDRELPFWARIGGGGANFTAGKHGPAKVRPLREQSPNLSPFSSLTRPSADVPEDFRSPIYVGRSIKRYKSDGDSLNGNRKQEARGIIGTPLAVRDRKHENIQTEKYIEKLFVQLQAQGENHSDQSALGTIGHVLGHLWAPSGTFRHKLGHLSF
ncbi:conserved hypothetical protein [Culex quinquefasciatus]|uniref:SAM domain-containing protein n=1 Tax=Culex quinquefasciatus TaxID=7176 RepID=B0WK01_CULQU|nr:conserved hypothetical protein [Culex quinquefasciatus]|eukprot:XP_001849035.1 conserved hypothetical protein [Culex quinquefasciatus]